MDMAAFSIRGRRKDHNQDAHVTDLERGLMVVCDGVTHCDDGGVASRMAVEEFVEHLIAAEPIDRHSLRFAIGQAQQSLRTDGRKLFTTLDAVVVQKDRILHMHVGDGRIFVLRDHGVEQLTEDQVKGRYLANAVGIPNMKAVGRSLPRTEDIRGLALMTDGVWGEFPERQMDAFLRANGPAETIAQSVASALQDPPPADDATFAIALF